MKEECACLPPGGNWKYFDCTEDRSALLEEKLKQNPANPELFSEWMAYLIYPILRQMIPKDERLTQLEKLDMRISELPDDSLVKAIMKHKRDRFIQLIEDMQLI